ncbi:helix-turn-helix transcriptional regulator [Calidifontibacter terrae]
MSEVSPTARALLTLELLQNRPGITGDQIAQRLGVTSRAARRYIAILREAGIPVQSVSGPAGGYRPGRGVRPPPLMFTSDEAIGLVMAALDGHHQVDAPDDPVSSALGKLLRTLPESVAAQAKVIRTTAAAAPDTSAARPDPGITAELVGACADRRPVRLDYRTEKGADRVFEVEPWSVVVRHGRWYLLCHSRTSEATRAYRVDRVTAVTGLEGNVVPPADLDPVTALEEHLAAGWEFEVEVEIDAPLGKLGWLPRNLGRLTAEGETTRLAGTTSNPWTYVEMLAMLPAPFRVVRGEEVRTALRDLGRRFIDAADS